MGATAGQLLSRLLQSIAARRGGEQQPKNVLLLIHRDRQIFAQVISGDLRKSLDFLSANRFALPSFIYLRLLQLCSSKSALIATRKVESHLLTFNPSPPIFLLNRAIETYANCGGLGDAEELFSEMPRRDGGSWNAMLVAYSRSGRPGDAVSAFLSMNKAGVSPNEISFAVVISACGDAEESSLAGQLHGAIEKRGFGKNVILASSLVDVYGKCGLIQSARMIFEEIESPNQISWNIIVRRYLEQGEEEEALAMFARMIREGFKPINFTVSNALVSCSRLVSPEEGRQIHAMAAKLGQGDDEAVSSSLIEMYAKSGLLDDARRVFLRHGPINAFTQTSLLTGYARLGRVAEAQDLFDRIPSPKTASWNALLVAHLRSLCWDQALELVKKMVEEAVEMDRVTVSLVLSLCGGLSDLYLGKEVHGLAYRRFFFSDRLVGNGLLDMYGKCGCLRSSELVFSLMASSRDVISWNALLSNYVRHGRSSEALELLCRMQKETTPNQGKKIHCYLLRRGCQRDVVVRGGLVDMYSKARVFDYARRVFEEEGFRDLVLWNSMILGCAYNGHGGEAPQLFEKMKEDGVVADGVTFFGLLQACACSGSVDAGREFFKTMSEVHGLTPWMEHYRCMMEMLAKHGQMGELEEFIRRMPFEPTATMWTRISDCLAFV
ncbi:pentatricopeptide repeat-containing protein At3g26540-like [Wolffia australiana]